MVSSTTGSTAQADTAPNKVDTPPGWLGACRQLTVSWWECLAPGDTEARVQSYIAVCSIFKAGLEGREVTFENRACRAGGAGHLPIVHAIAEQNTTECH